MKIVFALFLLSINFLSYHLFAINTYPVTLYDLMFFMVMAVAFRYYVWEGKPWEIHLSTTQYSFLGIAAAVLFSSIFPILSGDKNFILQYAKTSAHFFYCYLMVWLVVGMKLSPSVWIVSIRWTMAIAFPIAIFGVYQIFARLYGLPLAWINTTMVTISNRGLDNILGAQISLQFESFFRATSIFAEPSHLSIYSAFVVMMTVIPVAYKIPSFFYSRLFLKITLSSAVAMLFLAFSMSGLLCLGIMIVGLVFSRKVYKHKNFRIGFVLVFILLAILDIAAYSLFDVSVFGLFFQRFSSIVMILLGQQTETIMGESFFGRLDTIIRAFDIWLHYPISGIGLGCYYLFSVQDPISYVDSTFFTVLSETGIIGLVAFLAFLLYLLNDVFNAVSTDALKNYVNSDEKLLAVASPYIVLQLIGVFSTANHFVLPTTYVNIAIVLAWLNYRDLKNNKSSLRVFLVAKPIRELVYSSALSINRKHKNQLSNKSM